MRVPSPETNSPERRIAVLMPLIGVVIALVLMSLAYALAWPITIPIGERDARFALNFNAPERDGTVVFRWTTGGSTLALPRPPANLPAILRLRLLNGRPGDQPIPRVVLAADGRVLTTFDLPDTRVRTYGLLLPPAERADWSLRIGIQSDSILLSADPRPLGVRTLAASLKPVEGVARAPLWLLGWAAALSLGVYALARLLGAHRLAALAAVALLSALPALGVAFVPLDFLPFTQRLVALPWLGVLGILLARALSAPPEASLKAHYRQLFHVLHPVRGGDLPIYLAVAWWMLPLFQLIMLADGASVGLAPETLGIGGALVVVLTLVVLGTWAQYRGQDRFRAVLAQRALAVLALAALAHAIYAISYAFTRSGPDFWILFKGARDWARGGSMYDLQEILTNHFGHVFKVPPFYGMLFLPFVFQDGLTVLFYHRVLNTLLVTLTALIWLRMWNLPWFWGAAMALILLNARPVADTMAYGQIDLMLLFLLTLALWALRERRDVLAGILIAIGTLFKIYPVLLLGFVFFKRRWGGLIGFAIGMLACNGLAIAVVGWEMHRFYLLHVVPNIGGATAWVENQTIAGFIARLIEPPGNASIFENRILALLANAIGAAIILLACVVALRPADSRSPLFALQYGQFLLLMVLVVPAAWMHYETLLFVPFAALLLHERERLISPGHAAALALSFALIAYGNQWSFYNGTVMGMLTTLGVSYKFYGMLLLGGILAHTLWVGWFVPVRFGSAGPAAEQAAR